MTNAIPTDHTVRFSVMLRSPFNGMVEIVFSLILLAFIVAVGWESFYRGHELPLAFRSASISVPVPVPPPKTTTPPNTAFEDRLTIIELRVQRLESTIAEKHAIPLHATPNPIPGFTPMGTVTPEGGDKPPAHSDDLPQQHSGYFVAVGCYANHGFARDYRQKLHNRGFPAYQKTIHRQDEILMCVFVGPMSSETQAKDTSVVLEQNHGAIGPMVYPYPKH
ncbi:MAG: SPOR domain-containing protein [Magnetococcales bacterium]|nr:SPOR domain-containing protein [Magnetococcales bacterium]